jgi:ribonuclease BN (tRNA processing enzyme)
LFGGADPIVRQIQEVHVVVKERLLVTRPDLQFLSQNDQSVGVAASDRAIRHLSHGLTDQTDVFVQTGVDDTLLDVLGSLPTFSPDVIPRGPTKHFPRGCRQIIRIHKSYAHPGGVYVYRITWRGKSVVYATDTEGYVGMDRRLVAFARDSDVLIHDAQYLDEHYWGQLEGFPATQGFGHSTVTMACEVAAASEAGQLILFHHDPAYSDAMVAGMDASAKAQFGEAQAAHEGLEIVLHEENMAVRLQSPAVNGRDVQYAQNG